MLRLLPALALALALQILNAGCAPAAEETFAPLSTLPPATFEPNDWPWWRGPAMDGIASADQEPPTEWSESKNVLWKIDVPGRGHSSPIVAGEHVYLTTADEQQKVQSVLCFDRSTGKPLWKTDVHSGPLATGVNKKASHASSSVACDGERLFATFVNDGVAYATALSREGKQLWQTKICDFTMHQGFGASPALYKSLVIVAADNKGGGAVAALDRATGKMVWKQERPAKPNYCSPILLEAGGQEQIVMIGCDLVTGFEPLTGKKLWEVEGATTECVTSTVTDGTRVITSGGYPDNHISAVRADGSGTVDWRHNTRVYVPSVLLRDGHVFGVTDAGVAMCWDAATGDERWKGRLGGTFSTSPVMVGDHVYATNEDGETYLFRVTPEEFELLGTSTLGNEVFATPTICGSRIYMRVARDDGTNRQEMLYCLGTSTEEAAGP